MPHQRLRSYSMSYASRYHNRPLPTNTYAAEGTIAFWERVYYGAHFRARRVVEHQGYAMTPGSMLPEDFATLSAVLGMDMVEAYTNHFGVSPIVGKYVRHYEIEPIALPG